MHICHNCVINSSGECEFEDSSNHLDTRQNYISTSDSFFLHNARAFKKTE